MTDSTQDAAAPRRLSLVVAASAAGTVFEWYDFFIFGSLAAIIAKHFFAGVSDAQGYLLALLTFAAGFAVRPFGAIVFGWFGDRTGRKRTFLVTISVMGLATFAVAFLPDYATLGVAAPYLLVGLRMLQGFAIGGEYGGAAIYVAEHTDSKQRGASTGWIQSAAGIGLVLALIVILITRTAMGEEVFASLGLARALRRVAGSAGHFAVDPLAASGIAGLSEDPGGRHAVEIAASPNPSFAGAICRIVLIALFAILTGQGVVWYTAQFYTQFFLERIIAVEPATVNWLMMAVTLISIPLYLFFGWLSDRIGRKPVMLLGLGMAAIGFIPGFQMLTAAANPALAHANATAPVVVVAPPAELLAAVRPDRQGQIRHRLRHRQERADQCRGRLHQQGGARRHAGRDPHRRGHGSQHERRRA